MSHTFRILFGGYAPVHFVCFRPIYERLRRLPGVELHVTGGLRSKRAGEFRYDLDGLYRPFRVPPARRIPVASLTRRRYDLTFSAHTSGFFARQPGLTVQIFHGLSFRNMAVREANLQHDVFFVIGPYMRRAFAGAGLLPPDDPRAIPLGFPKLDALLDGSLDREATLARLGARLGAKGRRPVLLYAPTGAKHNSSETFGPAAIRALARTRRYEILIKPHDHPKRRAGTDALSGLAGAHTHLVRDLDIVPALHAADLLITDASSVANEYTLMDRPIVFLDVPKLLAARRKAGGALDLHTWGRRGGTTVRTPEQAVAAVERALQHPRRKGSIRRAMAEDLFFNPGTATDHALAWVCERFGLAAPAAVPASRRHPRAGSRSKRSAPA